MPASDPIRLGSAAASGLTFETGSSISTSDSGIQTCNVKAVCADGSTIFNILPAAGVSFSAVFGNNYLPSSFLVDYTATGPQIEYLEGRVARATIPFRRQDPTQVNTRKIFVDSVVNYNNPLTNQYASFVSGGGSLGFQIQPWAPLGLPEPIATVKYNASTRPAIGTGNLTQLYALPGSSNTIGFPTAADINFTLSIPLQVGSSITYYNGTTFVTVGPLTHPATFTGTVAYHANPSGWQLTRLKSDPVAAASFYDVEEEWRMTYVFASVIFATITPPP